jgi:hypothetical protein
MSIIDDARGLLALMQPVTGTRATGSALAQSTGSTGIVPANAHAVPVVEGQVRPELLLKTARNPATTDGSWPIVRAGTSVPILSVLGGPAHNLGMGTVLRWTPVPDGVAPTASLEETGLIGGASNTSLVGVAEARIFEQLQAAPNQGIDFIRSGLSRFPGLLLVWQSSEPDDGQMEQPLGPRASRLGRGRTLYRHTWDLFVVVSRQDSDPMRREQGLAIQDELSEIMTDRQAVDGVAFSTIRGISFSMCKRWLVHPTCYAYLMQFSTANVLVQRDAREYSPWLHTRIDADTPAPQPFPVVHDKEFDMPR